MRFTVRFLAPTVLGLSFFSAPLLGGVGSFGGHALSIGYPNGGRLVEGRQIRETAYLKVVPAYTKSPAKWAMPSLLGLLQRASRRVALRFPGSVLGVGELSNKDGGPIASHHSHQSGRDADVGFYLVNGKGRLLRPNKFVPCDSDGHSREITTTRFDERRNWALVEALLSDDEVQVRQIFVYAPLRAKLLAYAEKSGAPHPLRERAALALMQPTNALPHDDHFHVRIACPKGQSASGCIDDARIRTSDAPAREPDTEVAEGQRERPSGGAANATTDTPKGSDEE